MEVAGKVVACAEAGVRCICRHWCPRRPRQVPARPLDEAEYARAFSVFAARCSDYGRMLELAAAHVRVGAPAGGLSCLSVGAGTGHFDSLLLRGVLRPVSAYLALEPNEVHVPRLRQALAGVRREWGSLECEVRQACWGEAFVAEMQAASRLFDVVLFSHSLYHVESAERAVAMALQVLRPGGLVLAFLQTEATALSECFRRFSPRLLYVEGPGRAPVPAPADHGMTTASLGAALQRLQPRCRDGRAASIELHDLPSFLDCKDVVDDERLMQDMLSFFLLASVPELPCELQGELMEFFRSRLDARGRLPHGTGLVMVSA